MPDKWLGVASRCLSHVQRSFVPETKNDSKHSSNTYESLTSPLRTVCTQRPVNVVVMTFISSVTVSQTLASMSEGLKDATSVAALQGMESR